MVKDLEELIENWNSLKQRGKGYLEIFQETQASFGDRYFPFGVGGSKMRRIGKNIKVQVNEWVRIQDHLVSHFGLDMDFFSSDFETKLKSKYQVFVELLSLKKNRGRLFLYGEATRDIAGRLGPHYLAVEGDYNTLERTFNLFFEHPNQIREFVAVVFNWENAPSYRENPDFKRGSERQLDILDEAKYAHFLDIGKGYSWYKKWKIGHNGNPEVKTIQILS